MSWLGKVMGGAFGFLTAGPLGALLGAAVGHRLDQGIHEEEPWRAAGNPRQIPAHYHAALFSVMGHLAKTDGRVSPAEINLARAVMSRLNLSENQRQSAMRHFTDGKRADFPLDATLSQLRRTCHQAPLLRLFMEIQFEIALADGPLSAAKTRLLSRIRERLGYSRLEFLALRALAEARVRTPTSNWWQPDPNELHQPQRPGLELDAAYRLLGVKPSASDGELKRAYRRLLSRHHPDKLAASGQSESAVRMANEKTHQIRQAWNAIRRARNL